MATRSSGDDPSKEKSRYIYTYMCTACLFRSASFDGLCCLFRGALVPFDGLKNEVYTCVAYLFRGPSFRALVSKRFGAETPLVTT